MKKKKVKKKVTKVFHFWWSHQHSKWVPFSSLLKDITQLTISIRSNGFTNFITYGSLPLFALEELLWYADLSFEYDFSRNGSSLTQKELVEAFRHARKNFISVFKVSD